MGLAWTPLSTKLIPMQFLLRIMACSWKQIINNVVVIKIPIHVFNINNSSFQFITEFSTIKKLTRSSTVLSLRALGLFAIPIWPWGKVWNVFVGWWFLMQWFQYYIWLVMLLRRTNGAFSVHGVWFQLISMTSTCTQWYLVFFEFYGAYIA